MCTIASKLIDGSYFLIKTRDPVPWMRWDDEIKLFDTPEDKYKKLIIQNPDEHEDGYYGGINEKGVAYIATYVSVEDNQVSYIRRPYVRLILDASTAAEAVEIIKKFNPRIGGNMYVSDKKESYLIEGAPEKYYIEKVKDQSVRTNHFLKLPYKNKSSALPNFQNWSESRLERAEKLVGEAKNLEDLKDILRDRKNKEGKASICRTEGEVECCTHSAFIFDPKKVKVYYCQGNPLKNEFKEFGF